MSKLLKISNIGQLVGPTSNVNCSTPYPIRLHNFIYIELFGSF